MENILAILKELGKALNIPETKINELIDNKQEGDIDRTALLTLLKDGHRDALSTISRNAAFDKKKVQDEAYKSAERKIKGDVESTLKEKFDIDAEIDGLDSVVELAVTKLNSKALKGSELNDEAVKKHTAYLQLEKKHQQELQKAKEEGETAVSALKTEYQREKTFSSVADKALDIFGKMNPVLSEDAAKSEKQKGLVKDMLSRFNYEEKEGVTIITDKDGNILEDDLKNKLTLDAHVKNLVSDYFDFKVGEDRSAPNQQGVARPPVSTNGAKITYTGPLPKNKQEAVKMINDEKITLDHRIELQAWADANAATLPET